MKLMTVVPLLLLTALAPFVIGEEALAQLDSAPAKANEKMSPDISGDWMSDSPLESFVRDRSPQPVNRFTIDKLDDGSFQARYIGELAVGVTLKWIEEKRHFIGTDKGGDNDKVTFIVIPTPDSNVLTCKIYGENLVGRDRSFHIDKWRRRPTKEANAQSNVGSQKASASQDQSTVVTYDDSSDFTPEKKAETEKILASHLSYLKSIGFTLERGKTTLRLQTGMGNAHYYHNNLSIVMDPRALSDVSLLEREYNHHALSVALGDNAQEIFQSCSGIESALADYFGCSQSNDPDVGIIFVREIFGPQQNQHYLRSLDNLKSFTEISDNSGRHAVGEVLGGALWEIRGLITREKLDPLLYKAWVGIVKSDKDDGQIVRFMTSFFTVLQQDDPGNVKKIRTIFEQRGLQLP